MMQRLGSLCAFAMLASGLTFASAGSASAQDCTTDADCDDGFACQVTGGGGCGSPGCDDGGVCPPPDCEPYEYRECVPGPCESDADCADGMSCSTDSYEVCSGGGHCDSAGECQEEEPVCQTVTDSTCKYPYELPCTGDADCGEGYRCVDELYWECSATGNTGGSSNGGSDDPPEGAWDAGVGVEAPGDAGVIVADGGSDCTLVRTGRLYCDPIWGGDGGAGSNGGGWDDAGVPGSEGDAGADMGGSSGGDGNGSGSEEEPDAGAGGSHGSWLQRLLASLFGSEGCSVAARGEAQLGGNVSLLLGVGLALVLGRRHRR